MGALIAVLDKRGKNATETVARMLEATRTKKPEAYGIASATTIRIEKILKTLQTQKLGSHIAIGHALQRILDTDQAQPMQMENATLVFEGRMYPQAKGKPDAKVARERLTEKPEKSVKTLLRRAKGDFTLVVAEPERLIAARSFMGAKPLYYGENEQITAVSSERAMLWKMGIDDTESFPPGNIAIIERKGFKFKTAKSLTCATPARTDMKTAAAKLQSLLVRSTRERLNGLKEVAVAFSGGLDSTMIAFLTKKLKVNTQLIHVSLENRPETEHARRIAQGLELPLHVRLHKQEDVEKAIPKVIETAELSNPVQVSIGIPINWAAEEASKMDLTVMFAGQGADELFAGYRRYSDQFKCEGEQKTRRRLYQDVLELYRTNLERDSKICNSNGIELRLPFLSDRIVRFALSLPTALKIETRPDSPRKPLLRQAARNLGIPEHAVMAPKKAIQYGTGTSTALTRIARKHGMTTKEYLGKIFQQTFQREDQT